jgi:hypothetical protein
MLLLLKYPMAGLRKRDLGEKNIKRPRGAAVVT